MKKIIDIQSATWLVATEYHTQRTGRVAIYVVRKASNKKRTYIIEVYGKNGFILTKTTNEAYIKLHYLIPEVGDNHTCYFHRSYFDRFGNATTQRQERCVLCDRHPILSENQNK